MYIWDEQEYYKYNSKISVNNKVVIFYYNLHNTIPHYRSSLLHVTSYLKNVIPRLNSIHQDNKRF